MRKIIIFNILFACSNETYFGKVPPTSCYDGPKETENVGECRSGNPVLDENYNIISCNEQVLPTEEKCNGLDDSCSGKIDNYIYPIHPYDFWYGRYGLTEYPCLVLGECARGRAECINGSWKCIYPSTVELNNDGSVAENETRCDNLDNECDARTDEDVFERMTINERVCYGGNPVSSAAVTPCRAGLLECILGETICRNEITPSIELCNGIDDNCDSITDNTGDVLLEKYDIVFIIDTSGSMCPYISAVTGACNAYAAQFDGNQNFKFALVIMSKNLAPYVYVDTNFTDFANIRNRLQTLGCNGGGYEASLDSMLNVCDKTTSVLNLAWRSDANSLFFALTDERQQTYMNPPTTGQMIIDACIQSGALPFIWSRFPADFEYIAQGANGQYFNLVSDWQSIFNDMNRVILTLCNTGN